MHFNCPTCGYRASAPEECAGRRSRCRVCLHPLTVPEPAPTGQVGGYNLIMCAVVVGVGALCIMVCLAMYSFLSSPLEKEIMRQNIRRELGVEEQKPTPRRQLDW